MYHVAGIFLPYIVENYDKSNVMCAFTYSSKYYMFKEVMLWISYISLPTLNCLYRFSARFEASDSFDFKLIVM